jgi:hypothetical protein
MFLRKKESDERIDEKEFVANSPLLHNSTTSRQRHILLHHSIHERNTLLPSQAMREQNLERKERRRSSLYLSISSSFFLLSFRLSLEFIRTTFANAERAHG